MRFAVAFDLRHLHNRLITHAGFGIGRVKRCAGKSYGVKHQPVRAIGIMRHGDGIDTLGAQRVHPRPEIFWIGRHNAAERQHRRLVAPEKHIAMQVLTLRPRCIFITDERRETARLIIFIGRRNDSLPCRFHHIFVNQIIRLAFRQLVQARENLLKGEQPLPRCFGFADFQRERVF